MTDIPRSPFHAIPATHDDCALPEEHLFIEARELLFRLNVLMHALIPLEKEEKYIVAIRKHAERVVHKAEMRVVRRHTQMLRARMWDGYPKRPSKRKDADGYLNAEGGDLRSM